MCVGVCVCVQTLLNHHGFAVLYSRHLLYLYFFLLQITVDRFNIYNITTPNRLTSTPQLCKQRSQEPTLPSTIAEGLPSQMAKDMMGEDMVADDTNTPQDG